MLLNSIRKIFVKKETHRSPSSSMPMRILYILPGTIRGGAEFYLYHLLAAVKDKNIEPTVLLPEGPLAEWYSDLGIKVIQTPYFNGLFSGEKGGAFQTYFRFFRMMDTSFDLIHANSLYALRIGQYLAKKIKCPLVVHWHDNAVPNWAKKSYQKYSDMTILVPSFAVQTTVSKQLSVSPICIPNGVDLNRFFPKDTNLVRGALGLPKDKVLMGFFAVLNRHKGLDILLDILPTLDDSIHLVIAGMWDSEDARQHFQKRFEDASIKDKITFLGFREDISELLSGVDFICCPSENEAMPLIGLEALASGCPVLAHPVGGYVEMIQNGENGFLIQYGNRHLWKECIVALSTDFAMLERMRLTARISSERYDFKHHLEAIYSLYIELVC